MFSKGNLIFYSYIFSFCLLYILPCKCHDFRGFDDSILYSINWPGSDVGLDSSRSENFADQYEVVRSSDNEEYTCTLPRLSEESSSEFESYTGPTPLQLLRPLFFQKICSYRLESYWSYEICHGQYVRQYHEEREGKKVKVQEYFLGNYDELKFELLEAQYLKTANKFNYTKLDGVPLPYVEIFMDDGTTCDLNGSPRSTRIRYVCHSSGRHEVYSLKEIATCQYEVVILSPLLCQHPLYKPKEQADNVINCNAHQGSPKKPRKLLKMVAKSQNMRHQTARPSTVSGSDKDVVAVLKVETVEKDGETRLQFQIQPIEEPVQPLDQLAERAAGQKIEQSLPKPPRRVPPLNDAGPVREFLNGEHCLQGGTGWWKYEFCYGKHVQQYHVDRNGAKTSLLLGTFDPYEHQLWLKQNPQKAPAPKGERTSLTHFYSRGDLCDKTGRPRQTEVRLKCLDNSSSSGQVSLYLLEPKTCHYILGVESPIICEIIDLANDDGLIPTLDVTKDGQGNNKRDEETQTSSGSFKDNTVPPSETEHIEL